MEKGRLLLKSKLLLLALPLALAGCSVPSAVSLAPKLHMPQTVKVVKKPHLVALTAPKRQPGELDSGSASHAITVNGVQLVLNYWGSTDPSQWGPATQGTVNVSAQVQGLAKGLIAKITSFQVVAPPDVPGGHDNILVNDAGEFVIGAPYSYGEAFVMPQYSSTTKMVKLHIYVALEIETTPDSGAYTRQSIIDTLRVALVPKPIESNQHG